MKKQTFTEMLNGLIENGLTITRYQSPNNFDFTGGAKTDIDIYIDESKFHHCELYMIPDDMIKLLRDIFTLDFVCLLKNIFKTFDKDLSEIVLNDAIEKVKNDMNICRIYDVDLEYLEKSKRATKALFDDVGGRLDNQ